MNAAAQDQLTVARARLSAIASGYKSLNAMASAHNMTYRQLRKLILTDPDWLSQISCRDDVVLADLRNLTAAVGVRPLAKRLGVSHQTIYRALDSDKVGDKLREAVTALRREVLASRPHTSIYKRPYSAMAFQFADTQTH